MLLLKSTGSQFHGYIKDSYTTLPETWDRVLSTAVECHWEWKEFAAKEDLEGQKEEFDRVWTKAREITVQTFAEEDSASVQDTAFKMGGKILDMAPGVKNASYKLPNKHYFEISKCEGARLGVSKVQANRLLDLNWHEGIKNTGKDAEVYAPQWGPNGLIYCTVSRD